VAHSPTGVGRILAGRYRIERMLGSGASGIVWFVRDTREKGKVWALKELDVSALSLQEQQEAWVMFSREADMLMQLDHPYLPKVVARFQEHGRHFLVMERVEGPTLQSVLKDARVPPPESDVLAWGLQLCEVLQYLHTLDPPIVYRDLKPANVMVSVRGPLKLVDFGIARVLRPSQAGDTTAYGTPGYAPIEQYLGKTTPRSDLYALGATLYQLLTLQDPEQFRFDFPPLRRFLPEANPKLELLLSDLLQKEADKRPETAFEVQQRLQEIREQPRSAWKRIKSGLKAFWSGEIR
jgi:serine/threonine-protein kinase